MTKSQRLLFVFSLFLFSASLLPKISISAVPKALGMNINPVYDWSTSWMFVDRMKHARNWISFNADNSGPWDTQMDIPVDVNGYPTHIPFDPDGAGPLLPQAVKSLVYRSHDNYPAGEYTLIFEGTGTVSLSFDAQATFTTANIANTFTISNPSSGGLLLTISQSLQSDPVRNIRIIMPGFAQNYMSQIFHPLFLERLAGFKVIRFMDWGRTNNSPTVEWSDRGTVNHFSQGLNRGVAPEYMIALSNRLDADAWFCIPHRADDNYVRQLARLIFQSLEIERNVYVEYSNEVWNSQFSQATYVQDMGAALNLSTNRFQAGLFYNARRSAEIFAIFTEEFGGTDRLVRVIASQAANSWTGRQVLEGLANPTINPTTARADTLAIAPYFGGSIANQIVTNGEVDTISIDEILNRADAAVDSQTASWIASNSITTQSFNIPLITYEGGQHMVGTGANVNNNALTDKLIAANRHSRMKDIYLKMFTVWFDNGGSLFSVFNNVESPSRYGSWGVLEYQAQPADEAPKYSAALEVIKLLNIPASPGNLRVIK